MSRLLASASVIALLLPLFADAQTPRTERIASGFSNPVFATAPNGDTNRLFIVEQFTGTASSTAGTASIDVLDLNTGTSSTFLTLSGLATGGEQGLLGMAFAPDYGTSGRFYLNYTMSGGDTVIAEYQVSAGNPNLANPASARTLLTIDQPQSNHNGGWIGFSPRAGDSSNLYIATGDGGAGNDQGPGHIEPTGNAQNTGSLLGKILRVDISGTNSANGQYGIPANNPFVAGGGAPEIFALGLRNPYRDSFDRVTGALYIGDVGQGAREEIDLQTSAGGGENYGWRLREGTIQTPAPGVGGPRPPGNVEPILEYDQSVGRAITGGYVYRGTDVPSLVGTYIFGDFLGSGNANKIFFRNGATNSFTDMTAALQPGGGMAINNVSSFGEGGNGDLFIVDYDGEIYALVPEPGSALLLLVGGVLAGGARRQKHRL